MLLLPPEGLPVLALAGLVAEQCASAMPLVERDLSLHAELAGGQARPEAADVVERGVHGRQVVATWSEREKEKVRERERERERERGCKRR